MFLCENCNRIMSLMERNNDYYIYLCEHCGTACKSPGVGINNSTRNKWIDKLGKHLNKEEMHGVSCKYCGKTMISEEHFVNSENSMRILYCKHCNVHAKERIKNSNEAPEYTWIDEETRIEQLLSRELIYDEKRNLLLSLIKSHENSIKIAKEELGYLEEEEADKQRDLLVARYINEKFQNAETSNETSKIIDLPSNKEK